jgi:hypothetical protein
LVRCPVCESTAVTVVLNSKPHASCSCCGAQWIQEGSWQRAIRAGQSRLPLVGANGNGHAAPISLQDDVIALPDPVKRPRKPAVSPQQDDEEEAVAT